MKTLLIIDPIHSAGYLSTALKEQGIYSIALFSDMSNIAAFNQPAAHLFDRQIHLHGEQNVDTAIEALQNFRIDFVLNGCDQHLPFAEELARRLTPNTANKLESLHLRESKFLQQQAMAASGMPAIQQMLFDCTIPEYEAVIPFNYPVFAKPANGGGSIGIFMAKTYEELIEKLKSSPKMVNFDPIHHYLIQEYIEGKEVVIDSFSVKGRHYISNIFTYRKNYYLGSPVYRTIEPIYDHGLRNQVISFVENVLNACDYQNGFAHTELFHLENGEFRLIELNPRISGASGFLNKMTKAQGLNTQDMMLVHYLRGDEPKTSDLNLSCHYVRTLCLYTHKTIDFSQFASYHSHVTFTQEPLDLSRTPDLTDIRSLVLLAHSSFDVLEHETSILLDMDIL
ncbi:ATP-grasp domain-containing protein [Fastidiosibacter lacustris]|uniref:ATP-grasp domain-containing protein n=1 Tax=Fastidiosibacter lacustris TaxID=2056695 RepID=UPI000E35165A|nr:ATP-grasp domain-containing protein [Fastidiosibacter lacustris]